MNWQGDKEIARVDKSRLDEARRGKKKQEEEIEENRTLEEARGSKKRQEDTR